MNYGLEMCRSFAAGSQVGRKVEVRVSSVVTD
jgi:hypothetical protein